VRPRAGITIDRLLLYVTGGAAFGSVKTTDSFCVAPCAPIVGSQASASGIATKVGWTAGAGAEWAITNAWSIKAEYLYVDLGSFNTFNLGPGGDRALFGFGCGGPNNGFNNCAITTHHSYTDNVARVGFNYHFGAGL
jgi:outer membrane immunogenic protein